MKMKTCAACGKETNLVVGLGGVLLCRNACYPAMTAEIERLRAENKPVDVTRIAHQWRNSSK